MNPKTKKNIIIVGSLILILVLSGFGGKEYYSVKQSKKALETQLKNTEIKLDSLQLIISNSELYQDIQEVKQYNFYNEFKMERDLRIQAEKQLKDLENKEYTHRYLDSLKDNVIYK